MVFGVTWFIPFYLNYILELFFSLSIWSLTCTLAMHSVLLDICFTWNIGMFHVKHSSSCLFCSSLQHIFCLLNKKLRKIVIFGLWRYLVYSLLFKLYTGVILFTFYLVFDLYSGDALGTYGYMFHVEHWNVPRET